MKRDFTGHSVLFLTQIYCFSLLAYLPDLLGAIELLENAGYCLPIPCLSRNLLEWAANACFLSSTLDACKINKDDVRAIAVLEKLLSGNRWIKNQYKHVSVPQPIESSKMIKDYVQRDENDFGDADAADSYGMLCELTHANGMALTHYQNMVGHSILFKRDDISTFNDRVNMDSLSIIVFLQKILSSVGETAVSTQLLTLMKKIIAEQ